MNANPASDTVLEEIWAVKDRLSASTGHEIAATCRAIYAEQALAPERFIVLRQESHAEQAGAGQPATRTVDEPEVGDKPQPDAEGRSR
jgi:hypothetical protein